MKLERSIAWLGAAGLGAAGVAFGTGMAAAQDVAGKPVPGGMGFQRAVTPVMEDLVWLDDMLLVIITLITLFVMALLAIVIVRYNKKANPTPAKFTHNPLIEVVWTAVPVLILVVIAIPSLRLLFTQLDVPEPDLTIKVTGSQWYWSYQYPEQELEFDSNMVAAGYADWDAVMADEDGRAEVEEYGVTKDTWLLATDTRVVVPVNKNVHVLVTASDVIHAWAVPSFGVKIDTIPGRVNETWFRATETGVYYGQCSELCGLNHSYMPITVEVVTEEEFDAWVETEQAKRDGAASFAQVAD